MRKGRANKALSAEELRHLLLLSRRSSREARLNRYRRNGRAVRLVSDYRTSSLGEFRSKLVNTDFRDTPARKKNGRRLDHLFLLVEIVMGLSLIYFMISGFGLWNALNRNSLAGMVLPTLSPTPLIQAIVLPSGHTPPTSPGGARPNIAEIPEHMRPLVQSLASIPIPTPSVEQAMRIQIPAISIDAPIVQGDGWEQLKKGVAQHVGTANPGQKGNMVLSAHNDVFGELFRDLDRLKSGDEFTVFTPRRSFTYVVIGWEIVEPTRVEVMAPTPYESATLISCYPYLIDTERIVVKARLADD